MTALPTRLSPRQYCDCAIHAAPGVEYQVPDDEDQRTAAEASRSTARVSNTPRSIFFMARKLSRKRRRWRPVRSIPFFGYSPISDSKKKGDAQSAPLSP